MFIKSVSRINSIATSVARRQWFYLPSAARDRKRCCVHTETSHCYYDSQSGRHVPIHDESKITAYYHSEHPSASATEILGDAKSLGLAGALVDDDEKNIKDINASSFGGTVFLPSQLVAEEDMQHIAANINVCFELDAYESADDKVATEKEMSGIQRIATGQTSIGLFASKYFSDEVDPVLTASATASLMDNTGVGDFILLSALEASYSDDSCADAMIQLCEELNYLDVEGPTIKSRLIVSAMNDDQVEECLMMGINKYIVADETGLDMLQNIVEEQGKQSMHNK